MYSRKRCREEKCGDTSIFTTNVCDYNVDALLFSYLPCITAIGSLLVSLKGSRYFVQVLSSVWNIQNFTLSQQEL